MFLTLKSLIQVQLSTNLVAVDAESQLMTMDWLISYNCLEQLPDFPGINVFFDAFVCALLGLLLLVYKSTRMQQHLPRRGECPTAIKQRETGPHILDQWDQGISGTKLSIVAQAP